MEYEYNSFKIGDKETIALEIRKGIKRIEIKNQVVSAVKEIVTKYNTSYSDIAILFPFKQHKSLRYFILFWIKSALDEAGIPYSMITSSDDKLNERRRYSDTTGVVISTIDASLGLDFKAVILTGLYPYNYAYGENGTMREIKSWTTIKGFPEEYQQSVQSEIRSMYTACSRARDILYVLSDLKPGCPMEEIIKLGKSTTELDKYAIEKQISDITKQAQNDDQILVKVGGKVKHKFFGNGEILSISANKIEVNFSSGNDILFDYPAAIKNGILRNK